MGLDVTEQTKLEAQFLQENVLERNVWTPWFLETEIADTLTVAGEERVQLPVDFLAEVEEQALWRYQEGEVESMIPLKKMDYDDMLRRYPGTGTPLAYAMGGEYFFLGHIPDAEYTLKMRYFARDESLSSNIQNKWLKYASAVFLAELGVIMAEKHMQHFELAKIFRTDAASAWNVLYATHVARMEANQSRVMEA
jgi:hypothetical protein